MAIERHVRLLFVWVLAFGLLTAPFAARAQPAGKVYRIGLMTRVLRSL